MGSSVLDIGDAKAADLRNLSSAGDHQILSKSLRFQVSVGRPGSASLLKEFGKDESAALEPLCRA